MVVARSVSEVREILTRLPRPVSLVPTMGALHSGHASLIKLARDRVTKDGSVVVSIFVNPIQFDRAEDLQSYPRPLEDDLAICRELGVDLVFAPEKETLYQPDHSVLVTESLLSRHLCGATRPGHFDGVLTIVFKLFNILGPDEAVFGEKDFQQLALIRRMVRDLDSPVKIVGHPTVREADGLAMSSRNVRLTCGQRQDAARIPRALRAARDLAVTGQTQATVYLDCARSHLLRNAPDDFSIDYLQLVDRETLQPISVVRGSATLATACYYGEVRLIDHVTLKL
ncbi:MAG: pantoate--beta-alanine ligase [Akkermansiaceae bacterium]|jgi:pantoate--beta-alanine ligase